MRYYTLLAVLATTLILASCAGRGQYGLTESGIVAKEGSSHYLYTNGERAYKLKTKGDFELPADQCVDVSGRADYSGSQPVLHVQSYQTYSC